MYHSEFFVSLLTMPGVIGGYLYRPNSKSITASLITGFRYDSTKKPHRVTFLLAGRFSAGNDVKSKNSWDIESTEYHSISFSVEDVSDASVDRKKFYGSFRHLNYGMYQLTLEGGWVPSVKR